MAAAVELGSCRRARGGPTRRVGGARSPPPAVAAHPVVVPEQVSQEGLAGATNGGASHGVCEALHAAARAGSGTLGARTRHTRARGSGATLAAGGSAKSELVASESRNATRMMMMMMMMVVMMMMMVMKMDDDGDDDDDADDDD